MLSLFGGTWARPTQEDYHATSRNRHPIPSRRVRFIQPDGGGRDILSHVSVERARLKTLNAGDRVTFDIITDRYDPKKTMADNLRLIDDYAMA